MLPWHAGAWQQAGLDQALPQSLLLSGAAGAGLRELGWTVALSALCAQTVAAGIACGQCQDCEWALGGRHPDLLVLGADAPDEEEARTDTDSADAKAGGRVIIAVKHVRQLTDFLRVLPQRGRARVALLWPAEAMNLAASNALLKILEEPPRGTHLVLVSRAPTQLPATIRSRCRQVRLPRPGPEEAVAWVRGQAAGEAELALAQVGGAPLAASELDEAYWTVRARLLPRLAAAGGAGRSQGRLLDLADGMEVAPLVRLMQTWTYDLLSCRWAGRVRYHPDFARDLEQCALQVQPRAMVAFEASLREARRRVDHPLNARLVAEDLLMRYQSLFDGGRP